MTSALRGRRVGFLERPHPPGHRGALADDLIPMLSEAGARVDRVHAKLGAHRLDTRPAWDLVVLKSGSAAALHVAAGAEAWGIPLVNGSEATRLAQDKLATAAILQRAGLPIAPGYLAWLDGSAAWAGGLEPLSALGDGTWVVKAARGSQGAGLWWAETNELPHLASRLPAGPYLLMHRIPHTGDDLKLFAAGAWLAAIERPFPATTLAAKRGQAVAVPAEAAEVAREVGRLLDLTCFGCDFVRGPGGWTLVDVNAFPGYKGATGAADALLSEIARVAAELSQ
jgi:ribosomal protein S6--L-glutamate ligase